MAIIGEHTINPAEGIQARGLPIDDESMEAFRYQFPSSFRQRPIDALAMLSLMERAESIPTDDVTEFLTAAQELSKQINSEMKRAGPLTKFETMLTGSITLDFGWLGKAYARSVMETRIAKIAIAIRLFQKRAG
jgi:hypothetical protein